MRETLDQSMESFIPLSREIGFLKDYLELESSRFKDKFEYSIEVHERIDQASVNIPSMLIQPIVENSIWHGLMPLERPALLFISFKWSREESIVVCEIEDNGIGRKEANRIKSKNTGPYSSKGTQILKNRINIMKRLFHSSCELNYKDKLGDKGEATGTIAKVFLPVKMD